MSIFDEEWRRPVGKSKRELIRQRQGGRCASCGKSFSSLRVKPVLHHLRKSNNPESMQLLCPNCHSKAHLHKGGRLVRKRMGRGGRKKPKAKRKRRTRSLWDYRF